MLSSYQYQGKDTCAADGLCALACPVKIDTGKFIKELRFVDISEKDNKIASWIANHMGFVTATMRVMLTIVGFFHDILGDKLMHKIAIGLRWISGNRIPLWNKYMPRGAKRLKIIPISEANPKKVVYFPSWINRSMGVSKKDKEKQQLTQVMQNLLKKAGYEIVYPEGLNSLCCGMPF
ncbi:hypothetical protein [Balneicella halophila]|uniref:hypothetical protein n=1 Tax=Balneicella halophila TaxID=1537566 RepID=UPI0026CE0142